MPNGPHDRWKVLDRTTVFAAPPRVAVLRERVLLPDGRIVDDYYRVDLQDSVTILAETADGGVLCLEHYKHGAGRVTLTLPAGLIEAGEDPLAAARRELLEETGHIAERWTSLGCYVLNGNQHGAVCHVFHAVDARAVAIPDSGDFEDSRLQVLTRAGIDAALDGGRFAVISDAAAVALGIRRAVAQDGAAGS